ncbi:MAG: hypothetical protein ACHQNT_05670 [Bacteroidia bacterium]
MKKNVTSRKNFRIFYESNRGTATLTACFLIVFKTALSQDIALTFPLPDRCSRESAAQRDSILNYFYGVAGTGFIGKEEWIGFCEAKYQWGGAWRPIDGYKHTLCGYLSVKKNKSNKKYHLISDGDGDMVVYIVPDPAFRWLQFKSLRPQGHSFKDFSIACEVAIKEPGNTVKTDAADFFESFPIDSLLYKPAGVYGSWVSDIHHEKSPEIHPVQQMWRTEQKPNNVLEYQLYSFFDNSSRFDDENDFADSCLLKTWVPVPLINIFYVPFEITANDNYQLVYDITMPSSNNINVYDSLENQLRLIVNGTLKLMVNKPNSSYPKVTFLDVCQVNENTIHGYLAVETSIGKENSKAGAHAILKILKSKTEMSDVPAKKQ